MSQTDLSNETRQRRALLQDYLRIDPHQLGRQQLEYELLMRQCQAVGTLRVQANSLAAMLAHESQEGTDLVHLEHSPLPPDIDIQECTALMKALETELKKGRIDSHTLRALWTHSTHLSARLHRIRTAGIIMGQQKMDLLKRARGAERAVEHRQNPSQASPPPTGSDQQILATTSVATVPPATSTTTFGEMVHSTPDHPPTTSAAEMLEIVERMRSIYTPVSAADEPELIDVSPVLSTARNGQTDVMRTVSSAPNVSAEAAQSEPIEMRVGTPANHTTEYRERPASPDFMQLIMDMAIDEHAFSGASYVPNSTTPSFRMRPPSIGDMPVSTVATAGAVHAPPINVVTCTGAISKRRDVFTANECYRTPFSTVTMAQRAPRTIFATTTNTPITTAIVSTSADRSRVPFPRANQLTYTLGAPSTGHAKGTYRNTTI